MDNGKRRSNRAYWEGHVSAWRKSGMKQTEYCRLQGLMISTFGVWVSRIRRESDEAARPLTLIPVVVKPDQTEDQLTSSVCLQHHNGWQLQLAADVPASWLGKLMKEIT